MPPEKSGAFVQGSFRGNGVFIGLPVIIYASNALSVNAEKLASIMIAPIVIIFNLLAVIVLLRNADPLKDQRRKTTNFIIKHLFKNPMIVSCLAGIIINQIGITIPSLVIRPMDLLGNTALPLILLSIGATLDLHGLKSTASPTIMSSIIKVIIAPFIGFLLLDIFGLDKHQAMITLIFLGVPTAGTSYVMAEVLTGVMLLLLEGLLL